MAIHLPKIQMFVRLPRQGNSRNSRNSRRSSRNNPNSSSSPRLLLLSSRSLSQLPNRSVSPFKAEPKALPMLVRLSATSSAVQQPPSEPRRVPWATSFSKPMDSLTKLPDRLSRAA